MLPPLPTRLLIGPLLGALLSSCAGVKGALLGPDADAFCTVESGYEQGLNGADYSDTCPDGLQSAYLDGYQRGYSLHLAQREIDSLEHAIEALSADLSHVWTQLDAARLELQQRTASGAEERALAERIDRLTDSEHALSTQLDELEAETALRRTQLLQARDMFAASGP
jgi:hypothetical protein